MSNNAPDGVWRKSSRSNGQNNCVMVARLAADTVGVRDSKQGAGGDVLQFTSAEFAALKRRIVG